MTEDLHWENLVTDNVHLVYHLAKVRAQTNQQYEDFISAGQVALVKSAQSFDLSKVTHGTAEKAFSGYARIRINGAINDFLRSQMTATRNQLDQYKNLVRHGHGTGRSYHEIAEAANIPVSTVVSVIEAIEIKRENIMDIAGQEHSNGSIRSTHSHVQESSYLVTEAQGRVVEAIDALPRDQQALVALVFYEGYTIRETSMMLGINPRLATQGFHEAMLSIHSVLMSLMKEENNA